MSSALRNTLRLFGLAALVAAMIAGNIGQTRAMAEEAGVAGADAVAAPQRGPGELMAKNLLDVLRDGGLMMMPLFACSFITLVFLFERAISLRRGRVIPRPFVRRFLHQMREGKWDREQALESCQENGSPMAEVFAAIVRKWGRPSVELEQSLIDAGERAAVGLRRYIRVFNAAATVSPLMGLLGTVFGMMRMFSAISTAEAMHRTELLASGISEALFTTAAGLLIAIPALCFYLFFVGRVEKLLGDMDGLGQEVVGLISAEALHEDRQGKLRGKGRSTAA
ncbi:MAG TPA: MotA/TolQ/ExbB proton channel family protein [Pirellulales bacterium]|jgi:biopolymer transport protein ExbB